MVVGWLVGGLYGVIVRCSAGWLVGWTFAFVCPSNIWAGRLDKCVCVCPIRLQELDRLAALKSKVGQKGCSIKDV